MAEPDSKRTERALRRLYAVKRAAVPPGDIDRIVKLMLEEDPRFRKVGESAGMLGFVCAQVRFVPMWVWVAQLCVVSVMVWTALVCGDADPVRWAVGAMSVASVLVCVPTLISDKRHRVVELEYACRFDAADVLAARLLILGCSCSLAVALMVAGTSAATDLGALEVALWACTPYFLACATALAALRRLTPEAAVSVSVAGAAAVCGALLVVSEAFPGTYDAAALGAWGLAAAAAGAWLVREAILLLCAAAQGLDSLYPRLSENHG